MSQGPRTMVDDVRRLLLQRTARLMRIAARAREGNDREAVHDLRVVIRRLEASLGVWQDALAATPLRRARRGLRRLRRWAGETREHEVHGAEIRRALPAAPPELRPALMQVSEDLERSLAHQQDQLAARLGPARLERLQRRIRRALRPLSEASDPLELQRHARMRVERRRQQALTALLEAHPSEVEHTLHDARLRVKRWRYSEEALAAATREGIAGEELLQRLQQSLGEIQDLDTLREWALARSERCVRKGRPEQAAALAWLITRSEAARLAALAHFRSQALPAGESASA